MRKKNLAGGDCRVTEGFFLLEVCVYIYIFIYSYERCSQLGSNQFHWFRLEPEQPYFSLLHVMSKQKFAITLKCQTHFVFYPILNLS